MMGASVQLLEGGLICDSPVLFGPNKGQPARGTEAGYTRHVKRGEPPCEDCRREYNYMQRIKRKPRRRSKVRRVPTNHSRPEPLMTGPPKHRSTTPLFVGWVLAVCQTCGSRGKANKKLVYRGRVASCKECR